MVSDLFWDSNFSITCFISSIFFKKWILLLKFISILSVILLISTFDKYIFIVFINSSFCCLISFLCSSISSILSKVFLLYEYSGEYSYSIILIKFLIALVIFLFSRISSTSFGLFSCKWKLLILFILFVIIFFLLLFPIISIFFSKLNNFFFNSAFSSYIIFSGKFLFGIGDGLYIFFSIVLFSLLIILFCATFSFGDEFFLLKLMKQNFKLFSVIGNLLIFSNLSFRYFFIFLKIIFAVEKKLL